MIPHKLQDNSLSFFISCRRLQTGNQNLSKKISNKYINKRIIKSYNKMRNPLLPFEVDRSVKVATKIRGDPGLG